MLAIPDPVFAGYLVILLAMLFVIGMRMVIQAGPSYREALVAGIAFLAGTGFQYGLFFPVEASGFAGGLLTNGMTAGGFSAILMTLALRATEPRPSRMRTGFDQTRLPRIREFLADFATRNGWDENMSERLGDVAEEAMLALAQDEDRTGRPAGQSRRAPRSAAKEDRSVERTGRRAGTRRRGKQPDEGEDGQRDILLSARKDGGDAVLEFAVGPGSENLEDRIAWLGEPSGEAAVERDAAPRLLRHLASSVRHRQYHDTETVTVRVEPPVLELRFQVAAPLLDVGYSGRSRRPMGGGTGGRAPIPPPEPVRPDQQGSAMAPHPFDSDFSVTRQQKERFARDGFIKLKGFLNASVVRLLLNRVDAELARDTPAFFRVDSLFKRAQYDFDTDKTPVFDLVQRPFFRRALTGLVGRDLFLTFEMSFEIEKNVSKGYPWHVGVQSFGFQFAEDFGCTLWAPLHPIDAAGQRGGMAYVPQCALPGDFAYPADLAIVEALKAREQAGQGTSARDYFEMRGGILNAPAINELLETCQVEDDFEPGDALLFNKNVVHRSVMLGEGELPRRAAYVLRFVDATSRYDLHRARILEFPAEQYGKGIFPYKPITRQHIEIAEAGAEHGDLLAECAYFTDRDRRLIRRNPSAAGHG